jgi:hypothetical protein
MITRVGRVLMSILTRSVSEGTGRCTLMNSPAIPSPARRVNEFSTPFDSNAATRSREKHGCQADKPQSADSRRRSGERALSGALLAPRARDRSAWLTVLGAPTLVYAPGLFQP